MTEPLLQSSNNRIPLELQAIFLASNRGEVVDKPPENGAAFKVFPSYGQHRRYPSPLGSRRRNKTDPVLHNFSHVIGHVDATTNSNPQNTDVFHTRIDYQSTNSSQGLFRRTMRRWAKRGNRGPENHESSAHARSTGDIDDIGSPLQRNGWISRGSQHRRIVDHDQSDDINNMTKKKRGIFRLWGSKLNVIKAVGSSNADNNFKNVINQKKVKEQFFDPTEMGGISNDDSRADPTEIGVSMFTGDSRGDPDCSSVVSSIDDERSVSRQVEKRPFPAPLNPTTSEPVASAAVKERVKLQEVLCIGPNDTLQGFFDKLLSSRGYSTAKFCSIDTAYHNEATPLQEASYSSYIVNIAKKGDSITLSRLLRCGLSPNPSNYYGESLLHIVCKMGSHELLRVMLECGASVQVSDDIGRTPLHSACWATGGIQSLRTIELLLQQDTFLMNIQDSRGSTPLSYVRKEHWPEWVKFLHSKKDLYWPVRNNYEEEEPPPMMITMAPNSIPLPDPPNALEIALARMVAAGKMDPEDAMLLQSGELDGDDEDDVATGLECDDEELTMSGTFTESSLVMDPSRSLGHVSHSSFWQSKDSILQEEDEVASRRSDIDDDDDDECINQLEEIVNHIHMYKEEKRDDNRKDEKKKKKKKKKKQGLYGY